MSDSLMPPAESLGGGGSSASPQGSNPLSRKLHKILETRLDNDKEMLEALKALSTFFTENSLRTRRNLRGDIERRSLSINEEFVSIFKEVKEELESIHEDVHAMNTCCEDMTDRLKTAKEQTQDLIVKTTKLQAENQRLDIRAQVANAFLSKFQLTPDEMSILRGTREVPLTEFLQNVRRMWKEEVVRHLLQWMIGPSSHATPARLSATQPSPPSESPAPVTVPRPEESANKPVFRREGCFSRGKQSHAPSSCLSECLRGQVHLLQNTPVEAVQGVRRGQE